MMLLNTHHFLNKIMALPHFQNPIIPVYSSLFRTSLITKNDEFDDVIYKIAISFKGDIIDLRFSLGESAMFKYDPKSFMKDIIYITHISENIAGDILCSYLIKVEYIDIETTWDHNQDILQTNLKVRNIENKNYKIDGVAYMFPDTKSLQRDYKLEKILG